VLRAATRKRAGVSPTPVIRGALRSATGSPPDPSPEPRGVSPVGVSPPPGDTSRILTVAVVVPVALASPDTRASLSSKLSDLVAPALVK